jgi:hypothetical protein
LGINYLVVFAIYLHTRISKGWTGQRSAFIASFGYYYLDLLGVNLLGKVCIVMVFLVSYSRNIVNFDTLVEFTMLFGYNKLKVV